MSEELVRTLAGVRDILLIILLVVAIGFGVLLLAGVRDAQQVVRYVPPAAPACIVPDAKDPSKCVVTG
jgi:hypothetical protein